MKRRHDGTDFNKNIRICPNCSASVSGDKCEYCETVFVKDEKSYQFNKEQKEYFQRLNIINQLKQLELDHKNLEMQLAYTELINNTKQLMTECCCKQIDKKNRIKFPIFRR